MAWWRATEAQSLAATEIYVRAAATKTQEVLRGIAFAKLRMKYTLEPPRSRFKSLTRNLHVQQESVYRCFDGMPSLCSLPHSSSVERVCRSRPMPFLWSLPCCTSRTCSSYLISAGTMALRWS